MSGLKGRVALVTGGSRGVGAEIGRRLATDGARVVLAARNRQAGDSVVESITAAGGQAEFIALDVTNEQQWLERVDAIEKAYEGLHILVNNAGVHQIRSMKDTTSDDFQWLTNTNLLGPFLGMKSCIPLLGRCGTPENPARIINMSSVAALVPIARQVIYNMSKAGLDSMSKSVAMEVAGDRLPITVNAVNPGIVETEMGDDLVAQLISAGVFRDVESATRYLKRDYAIKRFAKPEDVAAAVAFLCRPETNYITGISLPVDGGYTKH